MIKCTNLTQVITLEMACNFYTISSSDIFNLLEYIAKI